MSVESMTYTIIEPGAYFICTCLPGMRPLVRGLYESKSSMMGSRGLESGTHDKTQGSTSIQGLISSWPTQRGGYRTSVSAGSRQYDNYDGDRSDFIRLEETVHVQSTPAVSAPSMKIGQ
ncbi:hypothetical protein PFICI_07956 [Pestalotiopsis fici W106-1]|uniref:Uncharacterized protein n=1 Tax=Pestalotiopsis fici (strain W106-1 / CGMCC3.15140) TaxID=1229662 RepID=W3X4V2_PESFW|nr:uncharacterized protein PFICI_07956 [Pestalotiopsis fici W106-1]ETS80427.1 hypothetical protein PFICI_07956 [Pestalotiopsis fici W106-1]